MTVPANVRVNIGSPFPATVKGSGVIGVLKQNGIWTISLNFGALLPAATTIVDPANSYILVWNALTGLFSLVQATAAFASKSVKTLTDAGPYAALPTDDVLIIAPAVAAPYTVTVDWSARGARPLTVVDGKPMADVNNISITPAAGQTQMGTVNYTYIIDGRGGSITLTPLPGLTGAY